MLLYKLNCGAESIYIYRQRHNGVVKLISYLSRLYAPGFISNASYLTKNKYASSLILCFIVRLRHGIYRKAGAWSFSHSANETLCAFTSSMLINNIGVDIEYVTHRPRKSIINYLEVTLGHKVKNIISEPHTMAIILISCMESAFKAWSFQITQSFSLHIFDVLLITEKFCQLRIKLNETETIITEVSYFLKDKRVVSVCYAKNTALT